MRTLLENSRPNKYIIAIVTFFAVVLCVFSVNYQVHAADSDQPDSGKKLVTIHDRGKDLGILTGARTVRGALDDAGIAVDEKDLVEPALSEELVAKSYDVNIYRARPVVVIDGGMTQKVLSPYQTSKQIAKDAGITLRDEDITTVEPITDMAAYGAGLQVTIDRATAFTLVLYGKKTEAYSQEETVGEMLAAKGIELGKDDTLSVSKGAPLTEGLTVEVWHNGTQTVTVEEDVDFPIEKVQDADRDITYHRVQTAGEKGKRSVTYEIVMKNGAEQSKKEIQSVVLKEPKKQVEIIGTKVNLPAGSHEDWMAAAGISSSDYGFVNYIVMREGGWEPCKVQGGAINCSYSGLMGYGMVQATPGSKMASAGDDWRTNPITQLRWATGYAVGRYGSWQAAYNYWISHHNW